MTNHNQHDPNQGEPQPLNPFVNRLARLATSVIEACKTFPAPQTSSSIYKPEEEVLGDNMSPAMYRVYDAARRRSLLNE